MNRKLLLVGCAREGSSRVPGKMVRPFAGTTLFEIYLKKFEKISKVNNPFDDIIMAVNKNDNMLYNLCNDTPIKIIDRSDESVASWNSSISLTYHFIEDFNQDYIMLINGCLPLLKPETIIEVGKMFRNNKKIESLTCAKYTYNFIWNKDTNRPINNPLGDKNFSTARVKPYLEQVHGFHISNRKFLLENDMHWGFKNNYDPYLNIIEPTEEFLDVDTEYDFNIAECMYLKHRRK